MGVGLEHLLHTVAVDVMYRVETLGVARTVVTVPLVTVWPTGQVVSVAITTSVVTTSPGEGPLGAGVGAGVGGTIERLDGQLVMIPGFEGIKLAQMPTR